MLCCFSYPSALLATGPGQRNLSTFAYPAAHSCILLRAINSWLAAAGGCGRGDSAAGGLPLREPLPPQVPACTPACLSSRPRSRARARPDRLPSLAPSSGHLSASHRLKPQLAVLRLSNSTGAVSPECIHLSLTPRAWGFCSNFPARTGA